MTSLLPDFDPPATNSNGAIIPTPAATALAANPRLSGMGTITLSGSIVNGDTVTLTFTALFIPGGATSVSASLTGSDTATTVAQKLASAVLNSPVLQNYNVQAVVYSGALLIVWPGPLGTYVTMTTGKTGTGSEAFSIVQITGGAGSIIPTNSIQINYNGQILTFPKNHPFTPTPQVLTALIAAACPIS